MVEERLLPLNKEKKVRQKCRTFLLHETSSDGNLKQPVPIAVAVNRTVSHHREAYHWILFRITLDERNPVTGDIGEKGEKMCFFHGVFHKNNLLSEWMLSV